MTFVTGGASTATALLTVLQNTCTTNGWILNNGILSKNGCFIQTYTNDNTLAIAGGTGQSGANLTGTVLPGNKCPVSLAGIDTALSYPLTYHLHILDMEVYLFVNFNVDSWAYISFGKSPIGITATGNWYSGTGNGSASFNSRYISNNGSNGCIQCMMFPHLTNNGWTGSGWYYQTTNSFIHHGLDGNQWSCAGSDVGVASSDTYNPNTPSKAMGTLVCYPLLNRSPNGWNSEAIIIPITPCVYRPEKRQYIVGNLQHACYIRNDNYEPGQIIQLGSDKWRVYPWIKKNSASRDATNTDSGTFAVAVRYDGE